MTIILYVARDSFEIRLDVILQHIKRMWIECNGNGLAGKNCVEMPNNLRCLYVQDKQ